MPEKLTRFTDPSARQHDGKDRIKWVASAASQTYRRRMGKVVDKHQYYQQADANSTTAAGFVEMDSIGVTGGHPATLAAGDEIPINFGLDKTTVLPTSNRVATDADVGNSFALLVDASGDQYINMNSSDPDLMTVVEVLDDAGNYVVAGINPNKRFGNI